MSRHRTASAFEFTMSLLICLGGAAARAEDHQYLVAGHRNALPDQTAIVAAGGTWIATIDSIGVAIVRSNDPNFLSLLETQRSVELAAPDLAVEIPTDAVTTAEMEAQVAAVAALTEVGPQLNVATDLTSDPLSVAQWDHAVMEIADARNRGITGAGVTVAVLDGGIDKTNPDLRRSVLPSGYSFAPLPARGCSHDTDCPMLPDTSGRLQPSTCAAESRVCTLLDGSTGFDDPFQVGPAVISHGTAVAGIIAAECDNLIGICGIAPDAKLLSVKLHSPTEARFPISRILQALEAASTHPGVRIINASFLAKCVDDDPSCRDQVIHLFRLANRMLVQVHRRGAVIFAAAGNDGVDVGDDDSYKAWPPLDGPHVVAVGGIGACNVAGDGDVFNDFYDRLTSYSNHGFDQNESRYLVMPAGERVTACVYPRATCRVGSITSLCQHFDQTITTTRSGAGLNGFVPFSGTSAAAPHAAGLAALLLSRQPGLSAGQLIEAMLNDLTVDIGDPGYDAEFGYGRGSAGLIP